MIETARKYVQDLPFTPDGTSLVVNHGLGTKAVIYQILPLPGSEHPETVAWYNGSVSYEDNSLTFNEGFAADSYRIVVVG